MIVNKYNVTYETSQLSLQTTVRDSDEMCQFYLYYYIDEADQDKIEPWRLCYNFYFDHTKDLK